MLAQFTRVTATISIPAGAPVGMVDVTVITATSKSDPNLSVRVTDTTTVTCGTVAGADFSFTPSVGTSVNWSLSLELLWQAHHLSPTPGILAMAARHSRVTPLRTLSRLLRQSKLTP